MIVITNKMYFLHCLHENSNDAINQKKIIKLSILNFENPIIDTSRSPVGGLFHIKSEQHNYTEWYSNIYLRFFLFIKLS